MLDTASLFDSRLRPSPAEAFPESQESASPRASPAGCQPDPEPPRQRKEPTPARAHVGGVGDELPQEDLLIGIEGVDNERHELGDLRLEGESLRILFLVLHFLRHLQGKHRPIFSTFSGHEHQGGGGGSTRPSPIPRSAPTLSGVRDRRKSYISPRPVFIGTEWGGTLTAQCILPP